MQTEHTRTRIDHSGRATWQCQAPPQPFDPFMPEEPWLPDPVDPDPFPPPTPADVPPERPIDRGLPGTDTQS
jgi:hypothetical protein